MKSRVKRTLIWTWSTVVLAWAWAGATKLGYIPNWLDLEILCPWHVENYGLNDEDFNILNSEPIEDSIVDIYVGGYAPVNDSDDSNSQWNNARFGTIRYENVGVAAYKPIIYLYPEEQKEVNVQLWYPEYLSHTYPKYLKDWWNVIANPDWSLVDISSNRNLYALYWEGVVNNASSFSDWFVVRGEDTISFLEEKLALLWLNEREAEEFIVYWLPELENNKYNLIRFVLQEEIEEWMPLNITPKPDVVIRVLMQYKALDSMIELPEQKIVTPERRWFTVVEWWGERL